MEFKLVGSRKQNVIYFPEMATLQLQVLSPSDHQSDSQNPPESIFCPATKLSDHALDGGNRRIRVPQTS